ncbi:pentatricopeptide repeat-containing protein At1g43980, mitochondrial [Arachis stenosperma]|uniref:Pentatricopeptide repeat-containing protein n=1 Tax=Arachis hypogaea TaxID=3818 RepID=A0A445CF34_ARAHY|nr:pentatricopeptide repeat-containing protein At1g43980, mitochondrial [Arachis stenosperma]RYR49539.1 hypothetical protein Ahy_A07g036054 isoform G [Arachis hypogaea]
MYPFLKLTRIPHSSLSYCSFLLDHCSSHNKSFAFLRTLHAHFIKLGFNSYSYLGNRCFDLYCEFGQINDAVKVFDEITYKNLTSWNIYLKGFLKSGHLGEACHLFDVMPVRDVVSWNTMISGFALNGFCCQAFELFVEMQGTGVRPSEFTFSIMTSIVSSPCHAKQVHSRMIRSGIDLSNVVLANSVIAMYGRLGLVDYCFGVILTMENFDVISWNSLIWACCRAGYPELSLEQFHQMRAMEFLPDQFTCSILMSVCSNLQDLGRGKQVFTLCFKLGFVSNSTVSSAAIALFSRCNRLEDSIQLFKEQDQWDSVLCNSMISSYTKHDLVEDALQLFMLTLRKNIRPTEYMISCLLSSVSIFMPVEDLVSWNTIMMGMTYNGKVPVTMKLFKELIGEPTPPDRITLAAVLRACNYGCLVDEAIKILLSMEKEFGVEPGEEHYAYAVELLSQAGMIKEAMDIIETMQCKTPSNIWRSVLSACAIHEDLCVIERVAERITKSEPQTLFPYLVLAQAYQMRGKWESSIRARKAVEQRGAKEFIGYSCVAIKNQVYSFASNQLQHYGGRDLYLILNLLLWEIENEGCA